MHRREFLNLTYTLILILRVKWSIFQPGHTSSIGCVMLKIVFTYVCTFLCIHFIAKAPHGIKSTFHSRHNLQKGGFQRKEIFKILDLRFQKPAKWDSVHSAGTHTSSYKDLKIYSYEHHYITFVPRISLHSPQYIGDHRELLAKQYSVV